jgi:phosphocarrier protein HPr
MEKGAIMSRFSIMLKSINDVKEVVRIVNDFSYDIDLSSGRYIVDAKSIMGIFSLDLSRPITVDVHGADAADLIERLKDFTI